jgi:hypothetical protein
MLFFFGLPRFATDVPYPRKRSEYPDLWLYEHLSTSNVIFLFLDILLMVTPQAVVISHVPPSTDRHPSPPKPKRSPNYLFQEK